MSNIKELAELINKFKLDIANIRMESNEPSYHHVSHNYREEIIVPIIAIENNITFMINKGDRYIIFHDGVKAKVTEVQEKHICELEDDIQKLYGISAWQFMTRWYQTYKGMSSMEFVVIKVRKEGNNE